MFRSIFLIQSESRLRSGWRLAAFLFTTALIVNPLVMLLGIDNDAPWGQVAINVLVAVSMGLALWLATTVWDKRPVRDFGLEATRRAWKEGLLGFAVAMIVVAGGLLSGSILGPFEVSWSWSTSMESAVWLVILGQLARYGSGSFFEELMTRSVLLRVLAEGFNRSTEGRSRPVVAAWILSSLLFGLLHLFNPNATLLGALNVSLLGVVFGMGMVYTGRLALPIGLHAGWNVAQNVVFGLPNSGKEAAAAVLDTQLSGPAWFSGGDFGLEGGLLGTVLIGLIAVVIWLVLRSDGSPFAIQTALSTGPEVHKPPKSEPEEG